jgi:Big-like domain-containing protein
MDAASITSSTFTLKRPDGSTVAASVSYNATTRIATLQPSAALAPNTLYTARIETAVKAPDGMTLLAPVVWSFRTA